MANPVISFFKSIDNGLTAIEDYFDYRVKTGKWVGDVKDLSEESNKNSTVLAHRVGRSKQVTTLLLFLLHIWNQILRIPAFEKWILLVVDALFIIKKFFIETIITLQLSFLSAVMAYNLFINNPVIFFISFFPLLFFNGLLFSTLYYMIREEKKEIRLSIKESFRLAFQMLTTLSTVILISVILALVLTAAFFIVATLYSYIFTALRISWENAFAYWIVISPLFFLLLTTLLGLSIVASHTYFIVLFERKNIFYAFRKALLFVKTNLTWFTFFYLLFALTFAHFGYWLSLIFFPLGMIASLFFFIQLFIFLSFLLRREFPHKQLLISDNISSENRTVLTFLIIFGIVIYSVFAAFSLKNHDVTLEILQQTQKTFLVSQQLKTYTNSIYGFRIDYPQNWSIREEKDQSVTMYNNASKTAAGGIVITIRTLPFSENDFNKLYETRSGLTSYNTVDKNILIKINNLVVDNQYPAVKYSYLKSGDPLNEYSLNYLIHKNDLMYVISFVTYDKELQGENSQLFQTMMDSLRFE